MSREEMEVALSTAKYKFSAKHNAATGQLVHYTEAAMMKREEAWKAKRDPKAREEEAKQNLEKQQEKEKKQQEKAKQRKEQRERKREAAIELRKKCLAQGELLKKKWAKKTQE